MARALRPRAEHRRGRAGGAPQPQAGLNVTGRPALAFSPQRTAFVALGSDDANQPGLLVVDFVRNHRLAVPIDGAAMRLREPANATPAWLAHHYAWVRDASGQDGLQPRPDATPWPWQGQWLPFGGQWVPESAPTSQPPRQAWQPPGSGVRLHVSMGQGHVSVYEAVALGAAYSAEARAWVERVGKAWDAELRSGRHDAVFEAPR
ncbi:MAG: hypothetical protein U5L05_18260 [Rubrivivax sp.]|nr:hypothetical protein [Rubrivivax sp.]